jgi:hypothetical protein
MRRDGPLLEPSHQPTYRVLGLIVGPGALGRRLGYTEHHVHGPWLLKTLLQAWARRSRYIPWSRIASITDDQIVIRGDGRDLPPVPTDLEQESSR